MTYEDEAVAIRRAEIIDQFRLRSEERCAAASPSPGFPQVLESLLSSLEPPSGSPWIELSGGLGGVASWIERRFGWAVTMFDPSEIKLNAASLVFPGLAVAQAQTDALPLADASVDVVFANELVSTSDLFTAAISEAGRVLKTGGQLAVADLWAPRRSTFRIAGRRPHTFERVIDVAAANGFEVRHVAVAEPETGWWHSAARQVVDEIESCYSEDQVASEWVRRQRVLDSALMDGEALAGGVLLHRL